ncbi:MAG: succinyl-diaminopimelate desuccinylase [Helicobacteraceae bacterium]
MVEEICKKLLSYKTITPQENGIYSYILGLLKGFDYINFDKNGVKNILIYKKFSDGLHVNFAGHIDVVPPGHGWTTLPFEPQEKNGRIIGRGAQDMKGGVAAFLSALASVQDHKGMLSVLLTSDEEGEAKFGTDYVLGELARARMLPDLSIVAEPTCEKTFGDSIKIGRRGSINGYLELSGLSGHVAYPQKCRNPVSAEFGKFLALVSGADLDSGDEFFSPSKLIITDLHAGYGVTNLTPGKLNLMFNVRNSPRTSKDDVEKFVLGALKSAGISNFVLDLKQSSEPFLTQKGKFSSLLIDNLSRAVFEVTGVRPEPSTKGGTSDARFFAKYGVDVAEFGVINDKIHAPNESVSVKELQDLEAVFKTFLRFVTSSDSFA